MGAVLATGTNSDLQVTWEERMVLGSNWTPNDTLEFHIQSQGVMNVKSMGKGQLTGSQLSSGSFSGDIPITGYFLSTNSPGKLHVTVTAVPADLPKGWEAATDKDGHIYYYNRDIDPPNGKSQWAIPT